ncbi:MAG: hypothetical protein ACK5JF_13510 [Oscillospiraceae bacterium]
MKNSKTLTAVFLVTGILLLAMVWIFSLQAVKGADISEAQTSETAEAEQDAATEAQQSAADAGNVLSGPQTSFPNGKLPMYGLQGSWSLFNLFFAVGGIVCVGILLVFTVAEETKIKRLGVKIEYHSIFNAPIVWVSLASTIAAISLALFLKNENMALPMVFTNSRTGLMVILVVLEFMFVLQAKKYMNKRQESIGR